MVIIDVTIEIQSTKKVSFVLNYHARSASEILQQAMITPSTQCLTNIFQMQSVIVLAGTRLFFFIADKKAKNHAWWFLTNRI